MSRTSRYNDSIRSRISLTYTSIYLINCIVILITFVVGYTLYSIYPFATTAEGIADEAAKAVGIPPQEGDDYYRTAMSLIAQKYGDVAGVFVLDASGQLKARSEVAVRYEKYLDSSTSPNIFVRLFPQFTQFSDGYYIVEESRATPNGAQIKVLVYFDTTKAVRNAQVITEILAVTMFIGLFMFTLIGRARTSTMLDAISRISNVAKRINGQNLSLRIDESASKNELNELVKTINKMMDRIQASYDNQKRFVSDVSHELRTPISVISGYANMLNRWGKEDNDILEEAIGAIINEADMMNDLVEKLLFLARHDNETLRFEYENTDVSKMLVDSAKETLLVHDEFTFDLNIAENLTAWVDPQRIKQLFRILIDNSVKYSASVKEVNISLKQEEDSLYFSIKDKGMGISKENLPRIFDRFFRADESRTKSGYGLGLPMAEIIVRGHKGSITVRSKLNRGTEFIIRLPVTQGSGQLNTPVQYATTGECV